jgi:flagellar hook-associated protein 3 FlgL
MMRVTFTSQYRDVENSIETASSRLLDMQREVASGKRVSKPSDDPAAAAAASSVRARLGSVEQYQRAADNVSSRLTVVDTVLSDIVDKLTAAQTAATGARGTTVTATQREAAAQTLDGLRSALVDDYNSSFNAAYIFAGTRSTTKPYVQAADGTVSAYAGSATEVQVDIGQSRSVTVAFNGDAIARGSDADDVFTVMDNLITAVRAGDSTGIADGVAALGNAFTRATTAQSSVGVDEQAITATQAQLQQMNLSATARLSSLEDANLAEVIPAMNQADAAYRAALGAVGAASKVSLLDYLG